MPWRELDTLRRDQVEERIVLRRGRAVHGGEHALVLLWTGDGEHVREAFGNFLGLRTHAAGDDDLAVLGERGADGIERFRLRAFEEAAGIDDGEVGALVLARQLVALRAQ